MSGCQNPVRDQKVEEKKRKENVQRTLGTKKKRQWYTILGKETPSKKQKRNKTKRRHRQLLANCVWVSGRMQIVHTRYRTKYDQTKGRGFNESKIRKRWYYATGIIFVMKLFLSSGWGGGGGTVAESLVGRSSTRERTGARWTLVRENQRRHSGGFWGTNWSLTTVCFFLLWANKEQQTGKIYGALFRDAQGFETAGCWLARRRSRPPPPSTSILQFSWFLHDVRAALRKLGLVGQNCLERNLSAPLLRTLVLGRPQQSESIEAALNTE